MLLFVVCNQMKSVFRVLKAEGLGNVASWLSACLACREALDPQGGKISRGTHR